MYNTKKIILLLSFIPLLCSIISAQEESSPQISSDLLCKEILLTDGKTRITLEDFKENTIVLSFVEVWSNPAVNTILFLDTFYKENKTNNLKVIAISSESSKKEKRRFKKFVKKRKLSIQTGWVDTDFLNDFFELADVSGIPLSFVIKNGKIQGIVIGDSPRTHKEIKELVFNLE